MRYRPEIDGLRTVAVLPVILFHAGFTLFGGGFVGVDIFFVISGYLITQIIDEQVGSSSFLIVRFYERRIRRLLPALFLVLVVTSLFAWLWLTPQEMKDYGQSLVAVNLFTSNILFWHESGYFGAANEYKPLLHTWSLAVEEQFYLFFPLLLIALRNASRQSKLLAVSAITLGSFALAEWSSHKFVDATFFLLHTRAWELGVGALIALSRDRISFGSPSLRSLGSAAGFFLILASILFLDGSYPFPGVWALPSVLGAALIIIFATSNNWVGRLLSTKAFVGVGLISYSAYLWHQPMFAMARVRSLDDVPQWLFALLCLLSLGLAYLSWRFVEQPFRSAGLVNRRQIFTWAASGGLVLMICGSYFALSGGAPARLSPEARRLASFADIKNPRTSECMGTTKAVDPSRSCVYNAPLPVRVAIWGDSHADALAKGLADALQPTGVALREFANAGCKPALDLGSQKCADLNRKIVDFLIRSAEIDTVVVTGRYTLAIEGKRFDNTEGGIENGVEAFALPTGKDRRFVDDPARIPIVGERFREGVVKLMEAGKHIVLVYPVPEPGWNVPQYLTRLAMFDKLGSEPLSTSYTVFEKRSHRAYAELDKLPGQVGLLRVKPEEIFCNTTAAGRCLVQFGNQPLYYDDNHLGSVGAEAVGRLVVRSMLARGWLAAAPGAVPE